MNYIATLTTLTLLISLTVPASQAQDPDRYRQEQEPPDSSFRQRLYQEQDPEPDSNRLFRMEQQEPEPLRYRMDQQQARKQASITHSKLEGSDDYTMMQDSDYTFSDEGDFRLEDDDAYEMADYDGFRSEDDDDSIQKKSDIVQELASLQSEAHSKPSKKPLVAAREQSESHSKPSNTKPKMVTFEENTDMKALVQRLMMQEDSEDITEEDDDDAMSQWVMVSAEGYEYEASQEELDSVFQRESATSNKFEISEPSSDALAARYEASINATSQRVIGYDNRRLVFNSFRYPMSAMGQVGHACTGTFISQYHILTAGHCVYNPFSKKWIRNLNFRRGRNGNKLGILYRWKTAVTVRGWIRGKRDYDYAVIVVRKPSPSWMSFGYRNPMPRYYVNMVGYPSDKPGYYMWHSTCRLRRIFHNSMSHFCDTYFGMSGAAVYAHHTSWIWRYSVIYGIHVGSSRYKNVATRINCRRYRTLRYIIRRFR